MTRGIKIMKLWQKIKTMEKSRLYGGLGIAALLAVFFIISFSIRTFFPYDQVFTEGGVKFTSIDGYYHMYLVDNIVHNFPHLTEFNPYFIYPGGAEVGSLHFFDWLLAALIMVFSLGSPSQHFIDVMAAYFPVFLAAIAVVPVYFLGKALFNRGVGLVAAALVAVLPGEYLGRSILGFTDYHVAEALFSTVLMLFFVLAIKEGGRRRLGLNHVLGGDYRLFRRPVIYAVLAGVFLGIYLITWAGALLFVFIISLFLLIQFVLNHLRGESSGHLAVTACVLFVVAFAIFLTTSPGGDFLISLIAAILLPAVLLGISRFIAARGWRPYLYPVSLVGLGVAGVLILNFAAPDVFTSLLSRFGIFNPAGASAATTMEMQPLFSPAGSFTMSVVWANFNTHFYIGIIVLLYFIAYRLIYRRQNDQMLLLLVVWSLVILVAAISQRRFAYYLVMNVALLSAHFAWNFIWLMGLKRIVERRRAAAAGEPVTNRAGKDARPGRRAFTVYHINVILAVFCVCIYVAVPSITQGKTAAEAARFAPSDGWQASLLWMKDNTPEPTGDSGAYYALYQAPGNGEEFAYPATAYGVTSWWDYGYWITRIANRIPSANPSQAAAPIEKVAGLFLAQDDATARELADELGSAYLVIDAPMVTSKFWAMAVWAGNSLDEYAGVYYVPSEEKLVPVQFYYPAFYQSLAVRLYYFDGEAVRADTPIVITYEERVDRSGKTYRVVTDLTQFLSYDDARQYLKLYGSEYTLIAGLDPLVSPIDIEAVADCHLVYSSGPDAAGAEGEGEPPVKVFAWSDEAGAMPGGITMNITEGAE